MCDIPKNWEKWVESKYIKIERLGIVPGTWFDQKVNVKISNIFFHNILYTVRFVKIRRIQWYHFYYVDCIGKWPPRENMVLEFWHYVNDVIFAKLQCPVKQFKILVPIVLVSYQSKKNSQRNKYFICSFKYQNSCTIFNSMSFAPKNMILVLLEPGFYLLQGGVLIMSLCCMYRGFPQLEGVHRHTLT